MNTVIDTLNTGFATLERIALTNVHLSEWFIAVLIVASIYLLISRRDGGFMLLAVGAVAGAWLAWTTGHKGASIQQITLFVFCAYELLRARGWAVVKGR